MTLSCHKAFGNAALYLVYTRSRHTIRRTINDQGFSSKFANLKSSVPSYIRIKLSIYTKCRQMLTLYSESSTEVSESRVPNLSLNARKLLAMMTRMRFMAIAFCTYYIITILNLSRSRLSPLLLSFWSRGLPSPPYLVSMLYI